ncbi:MAG TPA: hypothetical protein PKK56_01635 [archaeon]|nr:hypothetical protein [archaeon]
MDKLEITRTLEKLYSSSKKRNFDESIELIVTFRGLNIKNKDHRFEYTLDIPYPFVSKLQTVAFVKDKNLAEGLKGIVDKIIFDVDIPKISKKEAKVLANTYDLFLAEGPVMLVVGKYLGQVLSPRSKMPTIIPPNPNVVKTIIDSYRTKIKISNKKNKSSVALQLKIGKKNQSIDQIAENVLKVYNSLLEKLPAGKQNIKEVYLKTTMSTPMKVGEKQ